MFFESEFKRFDIMNAIKMCGGIGNQLFQYAFGKALQKRGKLVCYDMAWYTHPVTMDPRFPRPFRLDKFQITSFPIGSLIKDNATVYDLRIGYKLEVLDLNNENNFEGYWQYPDYFKNVFLDLKKEYQLKTSEYTDKFLKYADLIWKLESVSVHVRRGDYQLHRKGSFRDLPADYYFDAMKLIKGDLFIFSDDLPWCRKIFNQAYFTRKVTFVDIEDYLAFELLRYCKHNIITNSTFSWWAAILNDNPGKVVICPKHYLWDTPEYSEQYRYPKEWIKIDDYALHNI